MARHLYTAIQIELAQLEALVELLEEEWGHARDVLAPLRERCILALDEARAMNDRLDQQHAVTAEVDDLNRLFEES